MLPPKNYFRERKIKLQMTKSQRLPMRLRIEDSKAPLWEAFKLVHDSYTKIWSIYMAWFTWFFGINLLALGWIITADKLRVSILAPVALLMAGCSMGGAIAGFFMISFSFRCHAASDNISAAIKSTGMHKLIFARSFALYVAGANIFGFIALMALWTLIAFSNSHKIEILTSLLS